MTLMMIADFQTGIPPEMFERIIVAGGIVELLTKEGCLGPSGD